MGDKERTLYCGNLSDKVTEDILYELFLQAGPLETVTIPKHQDGRKRNFGFITFKHAVSVPYTLALMDGICLYGRQLKLDSRMGSEAAPNPYMAQLKQYEMQSYHQHQNERRYDDRSRGQDSRRPRTDNYRSQVMPPPVIASPQILPVFYPGYMQQGFPMPGNVYPQSYFGQ